MIDKYEILRQCHKMKVGQWLTFDRDTIARAFPCWGIYNTHKENLLSNLMGSGYGEFTVDANEFDLSWTVKRHEGSNKRVYVDPDRAHLYVLMEAGYCDAHDKPPRTVTESIQEAPENGTYFKGGRL